MKIGSLFSGAGGLDLGLERAGHEVVWQVEIDKQCRQVLRRHWPDVELYEDVCDVSRSNLARVECIAGGFPCTDLSVAGKRAGLAGERSGLWWQFHRIIGELAPTWVLIENVPGLLSGCGCVTCEAVKRIRRIHAWIRRRQGGVTCDLCHAGERLLESHSGRNMAIVVQGLAELGYWWTYRVVDSQYFNVAQRRERVFIVGHLGGPCPPEILLEPESVCGDTPPSRETGQEVAGSIGGRAGGEGGQRNDLDNHGAYPLTAQEGKGPNSDCDSGNMVLEDQGGDVMRVTDKPGALRAQSHQHEPIVVTPLDMRNASRTSEPSDMNRQGVGVGEDGDPSPTLTDVFVPAVAFHHKASAHQSMNPSELVPALGTTKEPAVFRKAQKAHDPEPVAFREDQRTGTCFETRIGAVPRRLTPVECERLQGWPDDWTRYGIDEDGKEIELADGPRYRMCGNGVTSTVSEWIGRRFP